MNCVFSEGVDDDIGSEYGSEFSDSSDGSSMYSESMYSESMSSEVPEGWEWSEEHQDYIYVGLVMVYSSASISVKIRFFFIGLVL